MQSDRIPVRRAGFDLFLVSLLLLFLELACIRWFPAHVLYLTFFTNMVLLACFLGMSVGCLASDARRDYIAGTPFLLLAALGAGLAVEAYSPFLRDRLVVGSFSSPEVVFFGTEKTDADPTRFWVSIEALGGGFFLLLALALIGPGQELGRALRRVPGRVPAYTINILGSVVGIALFAACSWWELPPLSWFALVALGLGYLVFRSRRLGVRALNPWGAALTLAVLVATPWAASRIAAPVPPGLPANEVFWSPYYRIDFEPASLGIMTNLLGHQQMIDCANTMAPQYALPHLLQRDARRLAGQPERPLGRVLIIGAGSGNDVSRALHWGAEHIDAVEIDPVIQRLGARHHPNKPYDDPRVTVHLDDGRNFLRSAPAADYDLVIYALVDSLVLHSTYSNIRLESFLFTDQAFADVRRVLKPTGIFAMYNFFRQGWIVARLRAGVRHAFGTEPIVMPFRYRPVIAPNEEAGGVTLLLAGTEDSLQPLRAAFAARNFYWINTRNKLEPDAPDGFTLPAEAERQRIRSRLGEENPQDKRWFVFGTAAVEEPADGLRRADDDWPFLYLRRPLIPSLTLRGMAVMALIAAALLWLFVPRRVEGAVTGLEGRLFFLGAGFMLIETKAVVHLALLFGSTWMVNSVVFLAVLLMILLSNLFVLGWKPRRLEPYYVGLLATLALNAVIPLDSFLGLARPLQVALSCLLVFAPIFFAGVVFAVSFERCADPSRAFGANVAGAMVGGLAENVSMLVGFHYLVLVAALFYLLSAVVGRRSAVTAQQT